MAEVRSTLREGIEEFAIQERTVLPASYRLAKLHGFAPQYLHFEWIAAMYWFFKAFKNGLNFSGRASRPEFWVFFLVGHVLSSILSLITASALLPIARNMQTEHVNRLAIFLLLGIAGLVLVFIFGTIIITISAAVRRLHDTGRSGCWLLLYLPVMVLQFAPLFPSLALLFALNDSLGKAGTVSGALVNLLMLIFTALPGSKGENRYGPSSSRQ